MEKRLPFKNTQLSNLRFLLMILSLFSFVTLGSSQGVSVKAFSDTTTILIGQQFNLQLQLSHPLSQKINWIDIPDTLGKLEILQKSKIDTLLGDASLLTRKQILTITCFDSGFYVIPPFLFSYQQAGDTLTNYAESQPLLITVNTIPVDTTKAIKDIKAPVEVPWTFSDFLPYIGGVILAALLIWLLIYYLRKRKKKEILVVSSIPKRPAGDIALEELKILEAEKLWQQGNFKLYHTRLTDILRQYIENRWQITALEQTTDEILESFSRSNQDVSNKMLTTDLHEKLKYTLETADLVKFAKSVPVAYENEQCLANVYELVRLTDKKLVTDFMDKEAKK